MFRATLPAQVKKNFKTGQMGWWAKSKDSSLPPTLWGPTHQIWQHPKEGICAQSSRAGQSCNIMAKGLSPTTAACNKLRS